ncbi:NtaA/DmoA family FMN-dependent monooxygenase [Rhodococcus fascians]|nr:NtaA/DmoA family FMN-dependent monooxygenase [Rhodococcus fascians]MBY3996352.1 NtaA/DmoA family FMN-dependent monooxygenase [Rhodococcus fascians]MBY4002933.1 NtaA/DmoA family FMN-dependent monooxygenase [Rhodococcus fascians]MBY4007683.1 NtaA/DmoA family FMN-dependent monooxygenase [Rhodococcus fascians]MBY4017564.1 NtaA/DmoA family FMN-dependent monooxygenase [Rhodococcus fascians]
MFHLGWFLSWQVQSWNQMWSGEGGTEWNHPELYIDMTRSLERAGFDYIMFEDGAFVPDSFGGSSKWWLANARSVPKQDPNSLLPILSQHTERLGLIATMTTSFHPPYMAARTSATLDHLSNGRAGVNLVTSHNVRTAQNFGYEEMFEHDHRYEMADEWIELVKQLWSSWEPDSVRLDREAGIFADFTKVHNIDFEGKYHSSRGPLNTTPTPQGRPVICQAGGSPAGRGFAAKHAETILAQVESVEAMKAYRDDVRARMVIEGRDPDSCKIMFIVNPVLGETDREAQDKHERTLAGFRNDIDVNLASMSYASGIDFSKFDLDAPIPAIETNAGRATMALIGANTTGMTLREAASSDIRKSVPLIGTADAVAEQMGDIAAEVGGDGFLIAGNVHRRYISEITDGLAPELRKRGLIRDGYAHTLFRDNLMDF